MSSRFGVLFSVTTFGESHGGAVGVVIDGCPPRVPIALEEIQRDLDRRRPGQSHLTTARGEPDTAEVLSGVLDGRTLGTPIAIMVRNRDARSTDYEAFRNVYRPSHADYTYDAKYGIRAWAGGGRSSARETIGRVAAGAVARKVLAQHGIDVVAWVDRVADIAASVDAGRVTMEQVEATLVRCPDPAKSGAMARLIEQVKGEGDSVGGAIACAVRGVPAGLGEPVFDKLEADLAKAMLSLPASKAFEVGSGMAGTYLRGSQHNDEFYRGEDGAVRTRTNRSGGIQGGISNGEPIVFRVGFKPVATIMQSQRTVDDAGNERELTPRGRHDPCVLPRAVPMVEAMAALVVADHLLRQRAIAEAAKA
jgi:chorismate synthase